LSNDANEQRYEQMKTDANDSKSTKFCLPVLFLFTANYFRVPLDEASSLFYRLNI